MEDELMIEMLSTEEGREELTNCIFDTAIRYLEVLETHLLNSKPLSHEQLSEMTPIFNEIEELIPADEEDRLKWVKAIQADQKSFKTRYRASIEANYKKKISEIEEFIDNDE